MLKFRYPDKPILTTCEHVAKMMPSEWIAQRKYDGHRIFIGIDSATQIRCLSSSGKNVDSYTTVPADLREQFIALDLPDDTVLDAEFVGPRGKQKPAVYIFDCLAWNESWLTSTPFEKRWQKCLTVAPRLRENGLIHLAETIMPTEAEDTENPFLELFYQLKDQWNGRSIDLYEGIVLKRRTGTMQLDLRNNKKSPHLYKLKYRDIKGEIRCQ